MKKTTNYLLIILILALFIRLLFIFHPGFLADIAYWKWWSSASAEKGLIHTINYVNYNYPSFYLYILKATGHIYSLFASPNAPDFWNTYNPLFLFLIKLPYIAADLGIGILIFLIVKHLLPHISPKSPIFLISPILYLFNPVTIYNSAIWGQTDSLGTFFAMLAIYLAFKSKIALSAIIMSFAFFLKIQTNILILFTFIYIFIRFGLSNTIKAVGITTVSSLILNSPYLIYHTFDKVINTILTSFNYFPFISMNAYNLQWFLSPPGRPDQILDTTILFGNLSYKTFGLILFATSLLIAFFNLLNTKYEILNTKLIQSSALAAFAFFMFPTQMHERYIFPVFALLPIIIASAPQRARLNALVFGGLTITILLNLHLVMLLNYPETTNLPLLPQNYDPTLAHNLSLINVIIFILFLLPFLRNIPKKILFFIAISPLSLIFLIPQIKGDGAAAGGMISPLTSLPPAKATQGFGVLTKNKNLSGNRLSSSWVYYEKGLATHANSEIIYNLEKKYKTFTTDFGIDTAAQEGATVEFKILVDDKEVFKSGKMGKWDGPRSIKIDVSNAQKLTLLVTDAGDGLTNDHADWLNAKLIK